MQLQLQMCQTLNRNSHFLLPSQTYLPCIFFTLINKTTQGSVQASDIFLVLRILELKLQITKTRS
jgi:hypothetical protein